MIGKPGPFQIIENEPSDAPTNAPRRRYTCSNYCTCLDIAAALNWDNYTCRGCSGEIDESLRWRARQIAKKDKIVQFICNEIPPLSLISSEDAQPSGPPPDEFFPEKTRAKA